MDVDAVLEMFVINLFDNLLSDQTKLLLFIPEKKTRGDKRFPSSSDGETAKTNLHFVFLFFFSACMKGCYSVEPAVDLNLARKAVFKTEKRKHQLEIRELLFELKNI